MDTVSGSSGPFRQLTQECLPLFSEGISLILSRWTALQMAVENEWGGRDSHCKSEQLAADIFSWFSQSKESLYIDDLENIIDESMVLSFNTEIEDGSVEEVAEQLMIMQEEFLQGNYESIEKLRKSSSGPKAVSQSRQVMNEDDEESSGDDASDMAVDEPRLRLNLQPKNVLVSKQEPQETVEAPQEIVEAEDGWSVVQSRRNKGKR